VKFELTLEGLHQDEILTKQMGGLHVKHAVQRENFGTNSAFVLGPSKTTGNLDRVGRSQEPSGCKLTSNQQSATKYATPKISTYLALALFEKKFTCLPLQIFFNVHTLYEQHTVVYDICMGEANTHTHVGKN
jgi:hypothetical protein